MVVVGVVLVTEDVAFDISEEFPRVDECAGLAVGFEVKSDAWLKSVDGGPCVYLETLTALVLVPEMFVEPTISPELVGEPVTVVLFTVAVPILSPGVVLRVGVEVFLKGECRLASVPNVSPFLTVNEILVIDLVVACDAISWTE